MGALSLRWGGVGLNEPEFFFALKVRGKKLDTGGQGGLERRAADVDTRHAHEAETAAKAGSDIIACAFVRDRCANRHPPRASPNAAGLSLVAGPPDFTKDIEMTDLTDTSLSCADIETHRARRDRTTLPKRSGRTRRFRGGAVADHAAWRRGRASDAGADIAPTMKRRARRTRTRAAITDDPLASLRAARFVLAAHPDTAL